MSLRRGSQGSWAARSGSFSSFASLTDRPAIESSAWLQRLTLVNPDCAVKKYWDLLMKCFVLYCTLVIPCAPRGRAGDAA